MGEPWHTLCFFFDGSAVHIPASGSCRASGQGGGGHWICRRRVFGTEWVSVSRQSINTNPQKGHSCTLTAGRPSACPLLKREALPPPRVGQGRPKSGALPSSRSSPPAIGPRRACRRSRAVLGSAKSYEWTETPRQATLLLSLLV